MFRYYNMDHAIESGMKTAEKIIGGKNEIIAEENNGVKLVLAGNGK